MESPANFSDHVSNATASPGHKSHPAFNFEQSCNVHLSANTVEPTGLTVDNPSRRDLVETRGFIGLLALA